MTKRCAPAVTTETPQFVNLPTDLRRPRSAEAKRGAGAQR